MTEEQLKTTLSNTFEKDNGRKPTEEELNKISKEFLTWIKG